MQLQRIHHGSSIFPPLKRPGAENLEIQQQSQPILEFDAIFRKIGHVGQQVCSLARRQPVPFQTEWRCLAIFLLPLQQVLPLDDQLSNFRLQLCS
ncbi:hypothetical protein D3C72_1638650 [compost metagenome]